MNGKIGWKTFLVIALFFLIKLSLNQYNSIGITKVDGFKRDKEKTRLKQFQIVIVQWLEGSVNDALEFTV